MYEHLIFHYLQNKKLLGSFSVCNSYISSHRDSSYRTFYLFTKAYTEIHIFQQHLDGTTTIQHTSHGNIRLQPDTMHRCYCVGCFATLPHDFLVQELFGGDQIQ